MPQVQLPFFPEGVTHINANLAFIKEAGRITYFNGNMPILGPESFAFHENSKVWQDSHESEVAKSLCQKIGAKLARRTPLGFGDQGLLVVFPSNCPNNSLPLLHTAGKGAVEWQQVFRTVSP